MDLIPVSPGEGLQQRYSLRQLTVSPQARELMDIQTTRVERRFVMAEVRMVGKIDYDETRLSYITARVPGRLDRLFVDYTGIPVKEGDHLVSIYSEELYSAQQELIEAVKSARRRGQSKLYDGVDLAESAREKLRLLGITEKQIADIEKQEKPSDHMTLYAPIGGIVVEKLRQEGDRVSIGDRIYTVADLSQLWVRMDAYESDLPWLRYGQPVSFTTEAYPGEVFEGTIAFIDPMLDPQTRTVNVRVNVENPDGKLKPDMFVRAVVKSHIAAGGRVMEPDLSGKWISPMHPEIVKDHPGTCDICGMPLVRAESLGYVSAEAGPEDKPLVIPVSAALVTGTRAIVYVEVPKTDRPTYVGREIVLGPRAGNYYLVRSGLKEGELVVTNGNFKLDSDLQIQAKPSMMTPQGGGGGGHAHGGHGGGPHPKAEHADHEMSQIPQTFLDRLRQLDARQTELTKALKTENLEAVRSAFERFGEALQQVDGEQLSEEARLYWKEFSMLLGNDVVEGREVEQLKDARRIVDGLTDTIRRVREYFGVQHSPRVRSDRIHAVGPDESGHYEPGHDHVKGDEHQGGAHNE